MPFRIVWLTKRKVVDVPIILFTKPGAVLRFKTLPLISFELEILELHDHLNNELITLGTSTFSDYYKALSNAMPRVGTELEPLANPIYLIFHIIISLIN
jgi:hypothetical protein